VSCSRTLQHATMGRAGVEPGTSWLQMLNVRRMNHRENSSQRASHQASLHMPLRKCETEVCSLHARHRECRAWSRSPTHAAFIDISSKTAAGGGCPRYILLSLHTQIGGAVPSSDEGISKNVHLSLLRL